MMLRTRRLAFLALAFATPLAAQQQPTGVTPIRPGQVRIVATYVNPNGKVVSDTTLIVVGPVPLATWQFLNTFGPNGASWNPNVTAGKPFCAFVVAHDSAGNVLTGRTIGPITSLDTSIAKITISQVCPDTTIDPAKMTANPLPPLQLSLRRRLEPHVP